MHHHGTCNTAVVIYERLACNVKCIIKAPASNKAAVTALLLCMHTVKKYIIMQQEKNDDYASLICIFVNITEYVKVITGS